MASLWSSTRKGQEINAARKAYGRAIDNMRAAFPTMGSGGIEDTAPRVIDALRGMGWLAWQELNEREGYRDLAEQNRFALVRQTRNSPTWGPRLIAAVNEPARLTLRYVRDQLRDLGVTIKKDEAGDFVVRIKGSPPDHGYFTRDLRDALDTGRAMAAEKQRNENLARLGADA